MSNKKIQGHVLIIKFKNYDEVLRHLSMFGMYGPKQISVQRVPDGFVVSRPLPKDERSNWKWLYEQCKKDGGPKNPDDTPPDGGSPGTPVIVKQTFTEARAA